MATIHFFMQGKGGVGKSLSAQMLAQYFINQCRETVCYDTDPVNQSFFSVSGLDVRHVPILEYDEINPRNFDTLVEELVATSSEETEVVIDNGASTFVPMSAYMVENDIVPMLVDAGHKVFIHVVIVGGQGSRDTANGLAAVIKHFPDTPIVIWENPWFGTITHDGMPFAETEYGLEIADRIHGIVTLPTMRRETFGKDLELMLRDHMTFAEVASETYPVMAKHRLKVYGEKIFKVIGEAKL